MDHVPIGDAGTRRSPQSLLSPEEAAVAFRAILDALSRVVSGALIDEVGWEHLHNAVRDLPVDPGIGFGFELRLGERAAGTDFYIVLPQGSLLSSHYIQLGAGSLPGSASATFGDRLATIARDAPWSGILGLEFDAMSNAPGVRPGLFARIRSDETGNAALPSGKTVAEWITSTVGWLLEDRESRLVGRTFDGIVAAGGSVDCVGIMPDRTARAFKIISRPTEPARALQILKSLHWNGPTDRVAAFLARFESLFRSLRLAVGVTADGLLPRIGLELFQGEPGLPSHPGAGDWPPFLARLCEDGLCLPEKMEGLLAWPGRELVFSGRNTFGVLTGLAHIKVSFGERQAGVDAKAYPMAVYLPFETIATRFVLR